MRKARDNKHIELSLSLVPEEFRFMFRKISLSKWKLAYWFSLPEFSDRMYELARDGTTIDNASVLMVMEEIFQEKIEDLESGLEPGFAFRSARQSINKLKKVITEQSPTDEGTH